MPTCVLVVMGPVQAGLGLQLRERRPGSPDCHRMWILCVWRMCVCVGGREGRMCVWGREGGGSTGVYNAPHYCLDIRYVRRAHYLLFHLDLMSAPRGGS